VGACGRLNEAGQRKAPGAPVTFDHANYDSDSDVLYLHVGEPREGEETPEGHVLRFAPGTQRIVGLTVLGARRILDRGGNLTVTMPGLIEASADDLAPALAAVRSAARGSRARRGRGGWGLLRRRR
jgi:uncharacterized protein YuzE